LDYSFWNDPEVAAARAEVISAAEAFEAGNVGEPALELAVILFNEVVKPVRTRLGHYKDEPDDGYRLTEEERRMVRARYMEEVKAPPPQTAAVVEARTYLLNAVRNLDKPLGKWEREFNLNCSCMRYETTGMTARREQRERERAWRGTKPKPTMNMENSSLSVGG
jgi:hypothetical protein